MDQKTKVILESLEKITPKYSNHILGIDGFGASGKSYLANELADEAGDFHVISVDEFYKPEEFRVYNDSLQTDIDNNFDWDRLFNQVFVNISNKETIRYQRYDWHKDNMDEWVEIPSNFRVIIEGVYVLQQRFLDYYDFKIWVSSPKEIRYQRAVERDGYKMKFWMNDWMPKEERYFELERPDTKADMVIEGY